MRKYLALMRIRFSNGLQYRMAAVAGIATQFAWGSMLLIMYQAFYHSNPDAFPMGLTQLASYIWMQQAFLSLFMVWFVERDIFECITSGGVAYELCRPMGLYGMWYFRTMGGRVAKAALRCIPVLTVAAFLPKPFQLGPPAGAVAFGLFVVSIVLGLCVVTAFVMLMYILTFYTISSLGVRIFVASLVDIFSGAIIPLPFFPDRVRPLFELLPFAAIQDVPLRIYSGDIAGLNALVRVGWQGLWLAILVLAGWMLMNRALQRIVVQGG